MVNRLVLTAFDMSIRIGHRRVGPSGNREQVNRRAGRAMNHPSGYL